MRFPLRDVTKNCDIRVRGTSTDEMEPDTDGLECPWEDLWFSSNPMFVQVS